MVCKTNCATVVGVDVVSVVVETDVSVGLPAFEMVGLLSSDVKEAGKRVSTAIKNSGFVIPPKKITINFSPGNIRKVGTYFDVAVAVSVLSGLGIINEELNEYMFIGELQLDGHVVSVNGVLPIVLYAMEQGYKKCFVPVENLKECTFVKEMEVIGIGSLNELIMIISTGKFQKVEVEEENKEVDYKDNDFSLIKGQILAKRAAEIAAAGMHNLLLVGSPGTGKSMIAKAMPTIMPQMNLKERIEVSKIYSIAGLLDGGVISERPFRNPHHTATVATMIGGGSNPRPGEMVLGTNGVLFMDELPEFSRNVMEALRQPLEDHQVVISRVHGKYIFPAKFILVAAMNPCRCGYYPDRNKCHCTEYDIKRYTEKISGPIMDRIDLAVHVSGVSFSQLEGKEKSETSEEIRERVEAAVKIQRERFKGEQYSFNSQMPNKDVRKYCKLGSNERKLLKAYYESMELSARAYNRILKVARTIADLDGCADIGMGHLAEAINLRNGGQMYGA